VLLSEEWAAKFSLNSGHHHHRRTPSAHHHVSPPSFALGDPMMLTGMGSLMDSVSSCSSSEAGDASPPGDVEAANDCGASHQAAPPGAGVAAAADACAARTL
jgi:hypothetical protein